MAIISSREALMKEKIDTPNEKEHAWIAEQLERASEFVNAFRPQAAAQPTNLEALDEAFAAWMTSGAAKEPSSANAVINCVGIAFGQSLVEGVGLSWVVATDDHGTELAVYGLPGAGDVLVYPGNFVAKRWERGETNFLADSYRWFENHVKTLAQQFKQ
jgi:Domain of unknown function (DUF3806)